MQTIIDIILEFCFMAGVVASQFWQPACWEGFEMEEQAQYGICDVTEELLSACEYMISITGGSQHWNGETNKALKKIEAAIIRAKEMGGR